MAHGITAGGETGEWEIRVGGTREQCLTFLNIVLPDGREAGGGGLGGSALPPGDPMVLSVHRSDPDLHYLVGRVDLAVERVHLDFSQGYHGLDLRPVGASPEFGVAFVAAILPSSTDLVNATAWDKTGNYLGAQRTAHYAQFFQDRGSEMPDPTDGDRHIDRR